MNDEEDNRDIVSPRAIQATAISPVEALMVTPARGARITVELELPLRLYHWRVKPASLATEEELLDVNLPPAQDDSGPEGDRDGYVRLLAP